MINHSTRMFTLTCTKCNESLNLNSFLQKEFHHYKPMQSFIKKHLGHELICQEKPVKYRVTLRTDPAKVLDRSTPAKRTSWLVATKLLVEALERAESQTTSSDNEVKL